MDFRGLLPAQYERFAYIAGGFAACPALASDVDVWIRAEPEDFDTVRAHVIQGLKDGWISYEEQTSPVSQQGATPSGYSINIQKLAIVPSYLSSHPIHIMVTSASPEELLEGFDISTHQIALTANGVVKGTGWTPITEPPRVLKMTITTPERLGKIAARYGHSRPVSELV